MLLQQLSSVWQSISENNVFSCGGIMDKNLGLNVSVESLDKGGKVFSSWNGDSLVFTSIHWHCKIGVFNNFND